MRIKNAIILVLFPILLSSQIKVIDVGDGWKSKIDQAIKVIEKYDSPKYSVLIKECKQIDFGLLSYSTNDGNGTIILPVEVLQRGCINDIAACLVHEALHLRLTRLTKVHDDTEEVVCYKWELDFLQHIPNVEDWLINNAKYQISVYSKK